MGSLARGESSSQANPVLDVFTALGSPPVKTDVSDLQFRIFDISTPVKRVTPVQVHPVLPTAWEILDPINDAPLGERLGVGHYLGPWTVPQDEAIGDHLVEWQFRLTAIAPWETKKEEFFVREGALPTATTYCGVGDVRGEGFTDPVKYPDSRILMLAILATRYVDKVTGRWFGPRTFDDTNRLSLDGKGGRILHLAIPVIRLDKLFVELPSFEPSLDEVDLDAVRVYNRHMTGMTQPDDRENPRIVFAATGGINQVVSTGFFPFPRTFFTGRQNVQLEGVFGYTDPDGSEFGEIPQLIRQATCRLVQRDLLLDSDLKGKLNVKNAFRIASDKQGKTTIRLQDLWLKGGLTGDPEIDTILMAYRRPPRIGVA